MPVIAKQKITPRTRTLRTKRPETREEKMISALSPTLNVMVNAVRRVGQNIVHDFREVSNLQISEKGPGDFVSNADLYSEKKLIEILHEARPEYGFFSEECGERPGVKGCDYCFIVDPIDGTNNFIHAVPFFCISLALMKGKNVIAGVIFNPVTNELYYAEKGRGAFLMTPTGNMRLRVSGRRQLKHCLLASNGCSSDRTRKGVKDIVGDFASVRYMGSCALEMAMLAAGQVDAHIELRFNKWDVAAGYLLVQEAGGKISSFDGKTDLDALVATHTMLAANPALHAALLPKMMKSLMK
ncbi:MAG: inositol monophosphatase [Alphaproteobacteria bacterium]|nr:inositol monophosphatase [Alphaproteobacteria bacterium]